MSELAALTMASMALLGLSVLLGAIVAIVVAERRAHRMAPVVVLEPTPPQTRRQRPAAA